MQVSPRFICRSPILTVLSGPSAMLANAPLSLALLIAGSANWLEMEISYLEINLSFHSNYLKALYKQNKTKVVFPYHVLQFIWQEKVCKYKLVQNISMKVLVAHSHFVAFSYTSKHLLFRALNYRNILVLITRSSIYKTALKWSQCDNV